MPISREQRHPLCCPSNTKTVNGYEIYMRKKILIPMPPEQQRISDDLTSIDDLITAQSDKLEALKIHKKGLMQQLFPYPEGV